MKIKIFILNLDPSFEKVLKKRDFTVLPPVESRLYIFPIKTKLPCTNTLTSF